MLKGGIGGGKSFTGAAFACTRAYYDSTSRGLITANEYGQLETSTLVALAELCELFHVPLSPVGESPEETAKLIASRRLCRIFNAPVLVLSANKFGGTTEKARQGGVVYKYAGFGQMNICTPIPQHLKLYWDDLGGVMESSRGWDLSPVH